MTDSTYRVALSARSYTVALLLIVATLVTVHTALYLYNNRVEELPWLLLQLFDLDEENNIPTWFSSYLLLNNACLLYLYAENDRTPSKVYWKTLAAGFLLLSVDEVAGLHETVHTLIEVNWAIPAAIIVLIVGIAFLPFLFSLRRKLAVLLILSGILYVSGAIVVELLSADMDSDSNIYALSVAVEEGLEMLGVLLCITTILYEMKNVDEVVVDVTVS